MINVSVKEGREYTRVSNGPFPITKDEFLSVVSKVKLEMEGVSPLGSGWASRSRYLLKDTGLKLFDCLMLSNAVAMIAVGHKHLIEEID